MKMRHVEDEALHCIIRSCLCYISVCLSLFVFMCLTLTHTFIFFRFFPLLILQAFPPIVKLPLASVLPCVQYILSRTGAVYCRLLVQPFEKLC
jgi:hypothetical protein